jgi:hypothetical protein
MANGEHAQRGQATIDYVALIAVLAVLLGVAATVAVSGSGVANAVLGQVRRALCIVTGGSCPAQRRRPCVVASDRDTHHFALSIVFVRVDEDHYVLRERMSDGTVRLTIAERDGAGVEGGIGARARLKWRGRRLGFDREARAAVEGVFGNGRVYVARNDREADAILRAVGDGGPRLGAIPLGRRGPRPSEVFVEGGIRGLARVGLGGGVAGASLDGFGEAVVGARRDERSGAVTIALNAGASGGALLSALLSGPTGTSDGQSGLALTLDRDHRPVELTLTATGVLADGSKVPPGLAQALSAGSGGGDPTITTAGRRWEMAARVDLRDPDVAAAWAAFRHDPTDGATIDALAERLRTHAHIDVRSYAVSSESGGLAGGVSIGVKVGGEYEHARDRARLLAAASRPPFGLWEQRADCVPA